MGILPVSVPNSIFAFAPIIKQLCRCQRLEIMNFSVCVDVTSVTTDKGLSEVHSQDMAVARDEFFSFYTLYNRSRFICYK
jgi:hypothetical protein